MNEFFVFFCQLLKIKNKTKTFIILSRDFTLCLLLGVYNPGLEVIKLFSCSTLLSLKFIPPINVKLPTIIGILTFIVGINILSVSFNARKVFIFNTLGFMSS